MNSSILYLVPELMNPQSGVARYCRIVCRALLAGGESLTVVSMLDSAQATGVEMQKGMEHHSCDGKKGAFVGETLSAAMRGRPSALLLGHPNFAPLGWFLARLVGARLVTFAYGIDVIRSLPPWRRWTLRRSDLVIAISQFTARRASKANGIDLQKVRVLHNCLDPDFGWPLRGQLEGQGLSMLTVGRMSLAERYKGHDYVIRAMPDLLLRFPGLVYDIVGDGDWRPILENLAQQHGVAGAVRFHGFVSEEELRRLYSDATLFIMPSRAEGFGFVFLEAMVHGLPVVAGNVDASPEVVADGETGYLVDPVSVEAIVDRTTRLLSDDSERRRMGQAAALRVEERFSFEVFRRRLLDYLGELELS